MIISQNISGMIYCRDYYYETIYPFLKVMRRILLLLMASHLLLFHTSKSIFLLVSLKRNVPELFEDDTNINTVAPMNDPSPFYVIRPSFRPRQDTRKRDCEKYIKFLEGRWVEFFECDVK